MTELQKLPLPLLDWYFKNARTLPWRSEPTPYRVWISEIMLQQTRIEAGKQYFLRWMKALPDVPSLAVVSDDTLMKLWEGLGYYNRARNIKKAAGILMETCGGDLPGDYEALLTLPGIGSYTAGAIGSIAFGLPVPAVDGNVLRVLSRLRADDTDIGSAALKKKVEGELRELLTENARKEEFHPGDFNQALMELGALVCIPNGAPKCADCPAHDFCQARQKGLTLSLPVKTKKRPRRIEKRTIFVIRFGSKYLLHRRQNSGLLAGLWEFPNCEENLSPEDASRQLTQNILPCAFPTPPDSVFEEMESYLTPHKLRPALHVFSHVEWHMEGYAFDFPERPPAVDNTDFCAEGDYVLASVQELKNVYSLPSAFRAYRPKAR